MPSKKMLDKVPTQYKIDFSMCYESLPCKHNVSFLSHAENTVSLMSAPDIVALILKHNIPITYTNFKHFAYCFDPHLYPKDCKQFIYRNNSKKPIFSVKKANALLKQLKDKQENTTDYRISVDQNTYSYQHDSPQIIFSKTIFRRHLPNYLLTIKCDQVTDNKFSYSGSKHSNDSVSLCGILGTNFLKNIYVMKNGKPHHPDRLDFYLDSKLIKTWYVDALFDKQNYDFSSCIPLLDTNTVDIVITDAHYVPGLHDVPGPYDVPDLPDLHDLHDVPDAYDVFLTILSEKLPYPYHYSEHTQILDSTHELLYDGVLTEGFIVRSNNDISESDKNPLYSQIIICSEEMEKILSVSFTSNNFSILQNVPPALFYAEKNKFVYNFSTDQGCFLGAGIFMDDKHRFKYHLDTVDNENVHIKIYGVKHILISIDNRTHNDYRTYNDNRMHHDNRIDYNSDDLFDDVN